MRIVFYGTAPSLFHELGHGLAASPNFFFSMVNGANYALKQDAIDLG